MLLCYVMLFMQSLLEILHQLALMYNNMLLCCSVIGLATILLIVMIYLLTYQSLVHAMLLSEPSGPFDVIHFFQEVIRYL